MESDTEGTAKHIGLTRRSDDRRDHRVAYSPGRLVAHVTCWLVGEKAINNYLIFGVSFRLISAHVSPFTRIVMAYRIMFLVIAASVAALLLIPGDTPRTLAAIVVAGGAVPFRNQVQRAFERSGALNLLRAAGLDPEDIDRNL